MTNKILNLDISKEPKLNPIIYGRVGDGDSQRITVNTSRRDEQLDLTGYTITFEGVTSGGKTKVFDSDNVIPASDGLKKGTFDYVFPNMAFAVKGKYERAYFSFIKNGIRDTTGEIEIIVLDNADIDAAEAETIITEYNKLVTELRKLQDQAIADMNQNFSATEAKIAALEKQLSDTQSELQQALKDFENGNFWRKEESFNKEESSANVVNHLDKRNFADAWSWSANGTDRFTNVYPNNNLLPVSKWLSLDSKGTWSYTENAADLATNGIENGIAWINANNGTADQWKQWQEWFSSTQNKDVWDELMRNPGRKVTVSIDVKVENETSTGRGLAISLRDYPASNNHLFTEITAKNLPSTWTRIVVTGALGSNLAGINTMRLILCYYGTGKISFTKPKLEFAESNTLYVPSKTEDYVNSFPHYKGQRLADSNKPSDYDWQYTDQYVDYLIATYSGENVNKNFVGLGNVDNYATAKQSDAESGSAANKFVNPLGVKQFYDKQAIERPKFLHNTTNFCAHRGNNAEFPENSIVAFKSVKRHRFAEFDVGITKDGKWVVMHDDTVDRMTNGTGRVDSFTLSQIRALRIDTGANLSMLSDAEKIVPTLDEAIQCCKFSGSVPFIEIKSNTYTDTHLQDFLASLKQAKILNGGCVVISFDKSILERIRNMSNEIEISWILNSVSQTELNECIRLRMSADVAYNHATVTKDIVNAFHNNGLQFFVWTAPDDSFDSLKEKGVDVITTNSRSGDLRWSLLTLDNGFTHYAAGGFLREPFVEEVSPGVAKVSFTAINGTNTKTSRIFAFPDWALPMYTSWQMCNIRTSSGSDFATVDVYGRSLAQNKRGVVVGLGWDARTTWVNGNFTYDLY